MNTRTLESLGPTDLPMDDHEHDHEELPHYEPHSPPVYERRDSSMSSVPKISYHLRQISRKVQILVPFGPTHAPLYKIISRGSPSFLSKKSEMTLRRVQRGSVEASEGDEVATIDFDNNGPLPWCPRAKIVCGSGGSAKLYNMESRNFNDWKIPMEGGRSAFYWRLDDRPISLAFVEGSSCLVFARFTYSECGTVAANGAEVGELVIFRDGFLRDGWEVEMIASSCTIAITHFKKMGRYYRNDKKGLGLYGSCPGRAQMPLDAQPFGNINY
ncbi:uncharacterized protein BDZ99DRAFT_464167 [Mytilinidion resinicola]|uniref:Uncharacterized protein n=1 Tax=Mytilinidion resinicola TaxID=574789 RepID=A0A6A6YID1_9PEZI|nr:uncharacterized protein BDZ99DRAFT_464167 [Mytilinidion resinicola]KAF2808283.1 hypothetical protein BDZ99DRAFT_464167 [Mytilinidion resinicola]